jgi:hypothetical protein
VNFHFSCMNYGYYCLFIYSFSSFNTPSRDDGRNLQARKNGLP